MCVTIWAEPSDGTGFRYIAHGHIELRPAIKILNRAGVVCPDVFLKNDGLLRLRGSVRRLRHLTTNVPQHAADADCVEKTGNHQGDDDEDGDHGVMNQIFPPGGDVLFFHLVSG